MRFGGSPVNTSPSRFSSGCTAESLASVPLLGERVERSMKMHSMQSRGDALRTAGSYGPLADGRSVALAMVLVELRNVDLDGAVGVVVDTGRRRMALMMASTNRTYIALPGPLMYFASATCASLSTAGVASPVRVISPDIDFCSLPWHGRHG